MVVGISRIAKAGDGLGFFERGVFLRFGAFVFNFSHGCRLKLILLKSIVRASNLC